MRKGTVLGAALLSILLLVSGCGGTKANQGSDQTKPAETKPAETKPAETKPAETKPAEAKLASGKYVLVAGESKASYEVKEVFLIDALNNTAIGTSTAVTGDLVVENGLLKPSTVVVDLTKLKSDRAARDNTLKSRALETATYTTAEFTIASMEGGPLQEGQESAIKLIGRAKIHGVEQQLTWEGTAMLEGDSLKLKATVEFKMSLFNVEAPNIAGRIRVEDTAKLKVDFVAKKG